MSSRYPYRFISEKLSLYKFRVHCRRKVGEVRTDQCVLCELCSQRTCIKCHKRHLIQSLTLFILCFVKCTNNVNESLIEFIEIYTCNKCCILIIAVYVNNVYLKKLHSVFVSPAELNTSF